jgi:hypothetical protein
MPQFLNSIVSIQTLKNNQSLYEKVTSKFSEINNKKGKDIQNEGRNQNNQNNNFVIKAKIYLYILILFLLN